MGGARAYHRRALAPPSAADPLLLAMLTLASLALAATVAPPNDPLARGELLLGELGCTACHLATRAVEERLQPKQAPRLDDVGKRASAAWIRRFLVDPQASKPGATMPHVLAGVPLGERGAVSAALTHFLISASGTFGDEPAHAAGFEEGRRLYHEIGCVACHAPQEEAWELELEFETAEAERRAVAELPPEPPPEVEEEDEAQDAGPAAVEVPLGDLARKWSVASLAAFLRDPHLVRPSGRMPSLSLSAEEAEAIALYLLREQAFDERSGPERFPGLAYDYYEERFDDPAPDYLAYTPVRSGMIEELGELPEHRGDFFGFRFTGSLRVDEAGEYSLFTVSDDGSRLLVDGELVVQNDGNHAPRERAGKVRLEAGWHSFEVTMFEHSGGETLQVLWEGPGIPKAAIPGEHLGHMALAYRTIGAMPVALDPAKVEEGARWFQKLRCFACHESDVPALAPSSVPRPPLPLVNLNADRASGCIGPAPGPEAPRYDLTDEERADLRAVLSAVISLGEPQPQERELDLALTRLRCTACHSRGGAGGPARERLPYFKETGHWDLGDQGRIPPHLDEPGSKLTPAWLENVLFDGGSSRDYVATRMPQFGRDNLERLPALFRAVDAKPDDLLAPEFELAEVELGQRLAGKNGLGCIQCHEFAGYPSLGIPAVDLAYIRDRVHPGWFRRLLRDPVGINMNTRMPEFWVKGKSPVADVHGGDIDKQIDALWTYLTLGPSMPLPDGLVVPDEAFELVVGDVPRTVGVFMKGVSPRTLCVGFPVGTHYAWDMQDARLAKAWRGRFFNARGTWEGRAGALQLPPSEDVLDLPARPSLARLESREDSWPTTNEEQAGFRVLGRRFDPETRAPIFRYELNGLEIEERIEPEIREGGSWIRRELTIYSDEPIADLYFQKARPDASLFVTRDLGAVQPGTAIGSPGASREDGAVLFPIVFDPVDDGRYRAIIGENFTW